MSLIDNKLLFFEKYLKKKQQATLGQNSNMLF